MNVQDFTYLLQKPNKVDSPVQTKQLEDVLAEYPYFQAARAVHLKGLKNLNSYKYNSALKVTAAHIADREVLFDFITSKEFLQKNISAAKSFLDKQETTEKEAQTLHDAKSKDKPLPQNVKEAEEILDPKLFKSKDPKIDIALSRAKKEAEKELELGKPLEFTKNEKHSFSEWLQLASTKQKEDVDNESEEADFAIEQDVLKKKKFDLIDRFIETNPKIIPKENSEQKINIKESSKIDSNELMTETLAKVYLEQKKYKKAIQAYKILSLKYPEKSSFFADRIKAVEKIQQENI
ncbi:glucan-binding YG repeat protein [Saonia flava]|uniref:Glucan-binding YG repeat protein n=1 Tax=Saonia flava TaxID=523696 RepID=A0A846R3H9_9FLAO|nr:hypothetical protein [Saonia flava]NJB71914.1 glucan-binding YG repeat protein [Saonia flava]